MKLPKDFPMGFSKKFSKTNLKWIIKKNKKNWRGNISKTLLNKLWQDFLKKFQK